MRLVAGIVGLFAAVTIFTVASPQTHAEAVQTERTKSKKIVQVESGDTLSKIARRHKSTYKRVFYANKQLKDPDVIAAGQKLRIPSIKEDLKERPLTSQAATPVVQASQQTGNVQPRYQQTVAAPVRSAGGSTWDRLAACESGGNWSINTGNGYYGGLQFSLSSWRGVGGKGYPHQASKAEQIRRGEMLRASGGWGHWPACSAKLGLR